MFVFECDRCGAVRWAVAQPSRRCLGGNNFCLPVVRVLPGMPSGQRVGSLGARGCDIRVSAAALSLPPVPVIWPGSGAASAGGVGARGLPTLRVYELAICSGMWRYVE